MISLKDPVSEIKCVYKFLKTVTLMHCITAVAQHMVKLGEHHIFFNINTFTVSSNVAASTVEL